MDSGSDILHSGWLIKSPPEKKMNRGFFKAQWKRRYFVLQESSLSHMPGQNATLVYYKDEKRRDRKGTIDLEHCEEVLSSLDSPVYPHLFGIKTVHKKGTSRTYYLAAHSESDMTKWVDGLCTVLGLKENSDAASPLFRLRTSQEKVDSVNISVTQSLKSSSTSLSSCRSPEIGSSLSLPHKNKTTFLQDSFDPAKEEYIPLETCYSGDMLQEDEPVLSSIPLDYAPPPPIKTRDKLKVSVETNEETYHCPSKSYKCENSALDSNDNLYKLPPSSHASILNVEPPEESGNIYKYPPQRRSHMNQHDMFNMVPPPRSNKFIDNDHSNKDDNSFMCNLPYEMSEQVDYDIPSNIQKNSSKKSIEQRNSCEGKHAVYKSDELEIHNSNDSVDKLPLNRLSTTDTNEDIYDMPSNKSPFLDFVPPPPNPHKVVLETKTDTRYINLPLNSKSHPDQKASGNSYDFPSSIKSSASGRKHSDAEMLGMCPPPPGDHKAGIVLHRYTNAPPGYIPSATEASSYMPMSSPSNSGDSYVPMDSSESNADCYIPMELTKDQDYLNMNKQGLSEVFSSEIQYLEGEIISDNTGTSHISTDGVPQTNDIGAVDSSYDRRDSDIYSSPPSNRPISEDIYAPPPSNRPVDNKLLPSFEKAPVSSSTLHDMYPTSPEIEVKENTYDTPPPRPVQYKKSVSSPRFKKKDNVPVPSFNVDRSRSFKRSISPSKTEVPLPRRKSNSDDSSSSEEEETKSSSSHDQSHDNIQLKNQTHIQALKRSLHSTPPPPKKSGEIQYLELDLDTDTKHERDGSDSEKSPASCCKSPGKSTVSPTTDYREIDFVKTDALSATKREVENKRRSSEKSVDDL